jgi:hypothetical protein
MGLADNTQRDAEEFKQTSPVTRYLVQDGCRYSDLPQGSRRQLQVLFRELVEQSKRNCPDPDGRIAFGWKRAITTFTCEIFLDAYPEARTVHLVRDGRDAMLSRLNARMNHLDDPLNRLVVFGDPSVTEYRNRPLSQAVELYRNELEMLHWVTAVRFGLRARRYRGRYLEVRYEDLCEKPEQTMETVFNFLEVPFREEARTWIKANASTRSIGKWRGREGELEEATRIGEPLLRELGYI